MKYIYFLFFAILFISCSGNKREFKEFNQYGNIDRSNDYSLIGDFNFTIVNPTKISLNDFSGCYRAPLYLEEEKFIVATDDAKVSLISVDSVIWSYRVKDSVNLLSSVVADISRNLYFINLNGELISLDKNGKERFTKKLNISSNQFFTVSEPLIIKDKLIIGTNNGDLFKFDTSGNEIWNKKFSLGISSVFSADEDEILYIGLTNDLFETSDTLITVDKNGKEIKRKALDNFRILSPIINKDKKIYVAGGKRSIYGVSSEILCLDQNLTILWKREVPVLVNQLSHNGKLLFVGGFSSGINEYYTGLYAYDLEGTEEWKNYLDVKLSSPLFIGEDYFMISGTNENGGAIFILTNSDGDLIKTHSLSNQTPLYLVPTVSDNRDLNFFGSQTLFLVKLTETALDKLLPY